MSLSIIKDNFRCYFAKRFKEERNRLGLTQAKAAELCGVSRKVWGEYERKETVPGGELLFSFAAIGADLGYIMKGERAPVGVNEDKAAYTTQNELIENYKLCSKEDQESITRFVLYAAARQQEVSMLEVNKKFADES